MIITKTKFIIPTRPEWLVLLAMIGIFSFLGQVMGISVSIILGTLTNNDIYLDFFYHGIPTRNSQPGYFGTIQ